MNISPGFDTASEVALLVLAAKTPASGDIPVGYVLLFPLLFGAAMSLVDLFDGLLMTWAYGWAVIDPVSKLAFNLFLTGVSAMIAILVAVVEVLGCLQSTLNLSGSLWDVIADVNNHFEYLGYFIVALLGTSTLIAVFLFQRRFARLRRERERLMVAIEELEVESSQLRVFILDQAQGPMQTIARSTVDVLTTFEATAATEPDLRTRHSALGASTAQLRDLRDMVQSFSSISAVIA